MEVLTTRISKELMEAIRLIEEEEQAERAEVVRRLLDKSVRGWRVEKALKMIGTGAWTIRRAAKFAGLTYYEMVEKMAEAGVDSGPAVKDLSE